jgi:hypothetical protein
MTQLAVVLCLDKKRSKLVEFIPEKNKHAAIEIHDFVGGFFALQTMQLEKGFVCYCDDTTRERPEMNIPMQLLLSAILEQKQDMVYGNAAMIFRYPERNQSLIAKIRLWFDAYLECGVSSPDMCTSDESDTYWEDVSFMKFKLNKFPTASTDATKQEPQEPHTAAKKQKI